MWTPITDEAWAIEGDFETLFKTDYTKGSQSIIDAAPYSIRVGLSYVRPLYVDDKPVTTYPLGVNEAISGKLLFC